MVAPLQIGGGIDIGGGITIGPASAPTLPVLDITGHTFGQPYASVTFDITSDGGSAITEAGVIWGLPGQTTYATSMDSCVTTSTTAERKAVRAGDSCGNAILTGITGSQTVGFSASEFLYESINAVAYAINSVGISYSPTVLTWTPTICLAEGTLITLADGTAKTIENIVMSDTLRVWNFDLGQSAVAKPLWIKQAETTTQYNLLTFSDGSTLKTIGQHRIFNKQASAFTYPMTDATPIGTITVNVHGEEVVLIDKCVMIDTVNYYNVITEHHLNLYADGILTSMRYNNAYAIADMKFVKDDRALRSTTEFSQAGIADRWITGLRLPEQTIPVADIKRYCDRLEYKEANAAISAGLWHNTNKIGA